LPIHPIESSTVADAIIEKLEAMIVAGVFKPGDALLPERQLAKDFSVSRASLRQALSALEARGLISSRQGGGNYVCDVAKNSFSDPLVSLLNRHQDLKFQIIELRQSLEGTAAFYAAERATEQDKKTISKCFKDLQAVVTKHTPIEEAKADLELHLAIADAAHNAPLALMIRNIYALLLNHMEEHLSLISRKEGTNEQLQSQHGKLVEAVLAGDGIKARNTVYEHLDFVRDSFKQRELVEKRKQNAEMRAYLSDA
jgi:GntR family transcriptional repressor for pyruvate dehydrogenase complex